MMHPFTCKRMHRSVFEKSHGRRAGGRSEVIEVTKLDGTKTLINQDLIETVESTPDTVVTLTTGRKIITKESRQEIDNLVKSYRKDIYANLPFFDRL